MRSGFLLTLAFACTPATDAPAADVPTADLPTAAPATAPACAARVAAMRRALAHVPADAEVTPGQAHMQIPSSRLGQKFAADFALWLLADGTFDFEQKPSSRLTELLPRLRAALARPVTRSPTTLILFADRRVPAASVRAMVEALPSATKYVLAVQPADFRPPVSPPIPAWVAGSLALADIPKAEHPARLGAASERALGDCDAARDAVRSPPLDMVDILVHRIPNGLEACSCGTADVEALTAIAWTMVGNPGPPLGQIPLAITRDPQAEALTCATVGELATQVEIRQGRPFRLAP